MDEDNKTSPLSDNAPVSVDDTDSPPIDERVFDISKEEPIVSSRSGEPILNDQAPIASSASPSAASDSPANEDIPDAQPVASDTYTSMRRSAEETLEQELSGAKLSPDLKPSDSPLFVAQTEVPIVPQTTETPLPQKEPFQSQKTEHHFNVPKNLPEIPAMNANFAKGAPAKAPELHTGSKPPASEAAANKITPNKPPNSIQNPISPQMPQPQPPISLIKETPKFNSNIPSPNAFVARPTTPESIGIEGQTALRPLRRNEMPPTNASATTLSNSIPGPILRKNTDNTIPLREIPGIQGAPQKAKLGPANPPTKTIGTLHEDKIAQAEQAKDLQSEISSILPGNLSEKKESFVKKIPTSSDPNIKPLRTYESDVAEVMSHKRTSTAQMVIAESKRSTGEEVIENKPEIQADRSKTFKNLLILLISLIFIGGGIAGAFYLYSKSPLADVSLLPPEPAAHAPVSLIPSDTQVIMQIDGLSAKAINSKVRTEAGKNQAGNTIKEVIMVHSVKGQNQRLSGPEILKIMEIDAPDILARSLEDSWMLGIYADEFGEKSVFVVATTNFFQNAFAGMLQWESVMADDLKQYLVSSSVPGIANIPGLADIDLPDLTASTSLASSTRFASSSGPAPTINQPLFTSLRGEFKDRLIKNRDVRAFTSQDGRTIFMYSFIDNNKLIITGSETTLNQIISRLEKQTFVR